jgi:hypothetical protein
MKLTTQKSVMIRKNVPCESNASSKVKTLEKIVGIRSLARNTSEVEGCVGVLIWGLG